MEPVAPKKYQDRISSFDPTLRVAWNRRRHCFQVQRRASNYRRGRGWIRVLDIDARLRAGGPTDLGSGDAVISRLRVMDTIATKYGGDFDKWYEAEFGDHERQLEREDEHEREDSEVELVHEIEDTWRMRHHVPPTAGPVQSFKSPLATKE